MTCGSPAGENDVAFVESLSGRECERGRIRQSFSIHGGRKTRLLLTASSHLIPATSRDSNVSPTPAQRAKGTVKGYLSNVLAKLKLDDRTQAALLAVRLGMDSEDA
jgi:hypothetical protein